MARARPCGDQCTPDDLHPAVPRPARPRASRSLPSAPPPGRAPHPAVRCRGPPWDSGLRRHGTVVVAWAITGPSRGSGVVPALSGPVSRRARHGHPPGASWFHPMRRTRRSGRGIRPKAGSGQGERTVSGPGGLGTCGPTAPTRRPVPFRNRRSGMHPTPAAGAAQQAIRLTGTRAQAGTCTAAPGRTVAPPHRHTRGDGAVEVDAAVPARADARAGSVPRSVPPAGHGDGARDRGPGGATIRLRAPVPAPSAAAPSPVHGRAFHLAARHGRAIPPRHDDGPSARRRGRCDGIPARARSRVVASPPPRRRWLMGPRAARDLRPRRGTRIRIGVAPSHGFARGAAVRDRGVGYESVRLGAGSQWIVAARPLCHLQCPVAYLSRLQRILPAARPKLRSMAAAHDRYAAGAAPTTRALGGRGPLLRVG